MLLASQISRAPSQNPQNPRLHGVVIVAHRSSKMDKWNKKQPNKQEESSNGTFLVAKDGIKEGKMKRPRLQSEKKVVTAEDAERDEAEPSIKQNRDQKTKKQTKTKNNVYEREKKKRKRGLITDARFAPAQSDPRFHRMPKREAKVSIDSRFLRMLSDRSFSSSAAPVDKRGKLSKSNEVNPLLHYYLQEEEPEVDKEVKGDEVEEREQLEEENEEDINTSNESSDERTSSTHDEDEDDDDSVNSDLCRYLMASHEDTPTIEQETCRLAAVNMDWDHIKSVDLYVVMSSCLPKDGQVLSVSIYPSDFGLKCMEVEAVRGPTSLIDDGGQSEEEPDPEVINEKLRVYEMNKLRYYYAVVVFDSCATANHVYNILDGTELTVTSNVFDLRFIPDSMEFNHPPRDITTEAPTTYKEPDFQTRALQHSKVKLTWEDDEPQRVKTLRRKFNTEKLDDLNEYLASTDSSDDEVGGNEGNSWEDAMDSKGKHKKHGDVERMRALLLESNNSSDTDQNVNDKDMEITFNTDLEDLSKRILEKKDKKTETVWEQVCRRWSEKQKARKSRSKNSSDDSSSDYDVKGAPEQPDDFFIEELSDAEIKVGNNKDKGSKDRVNIKKGREQPQEIEKQQEASRAELELLFAEEQGTEKGPKGYKMKSKKIKGKKGKEIAPEDKLPNVDCSNDPRFSALFTSHLYALDPTDPQYKRSAAFARQRMQKQIGSKEVLEDVTFDNSKQASSFTADDVDSVERPVACLENEKLEFSSIVRSLKRNLGNMKK